MRAKSVQNRSKTPVRRHFAPMALPADFPIDMGGRHSPSTEPIAWLHLHDCLELGYCHEGAGIFVVEDKVLPFAAGDVSVINDREMHLARSALEAGSSWNFIALDPARLLGAAANDGQVLRTAPLCGPAFTNILKPAAHPGIAAIVRQLVAELETDHGRHRTVIRGLVLALMGMLHRLPGLSDEEPRRGRRDAAERLAPALDHLSRTYGEPVAMAELAGLCGTSESNLRRLFVQVTGRSPRDYLTYLRIQVATALLENTSLRVLDIAGRIGYPTLSSFNRHFRRIMRRSPRQWRRGERKQAGAPAGPETTDTGAN
jgi:AraC-like DNA-binding protein